MVGGKQLTVTSHVDDFKDSHVDENVVENFIHDTEMEFGKETLLTVSHGNSMIILE